MRSIYIWILAITFTIQQNMFFGWHFFPATTEELIVDGINMIIIALALMSSR